MRFFEGWVFQSKIDDIFRNHEADTKGVESRFYSTLTPPDDTAVRETTEPKSTPKLHMDIPLSILACILMFAVCLGYSIFCCYVCGVDTTFFGFLRRNTRRRRNSASQPNQSVERVESDEPITQTQNSLQLRETQITPPPRYSQTVTPGPPSYESAMKNINPDQLQATGDSQPWVILVDEGVSNSVFRNPTQPQTQREIRLNSPAINLDFSLCELSKFSLQITPPLKMSPHSPTQATKEENARELISSRNQSAESEFSQSQ